MDLHSASTRGRTLDHAAGLYDIVEPLVLMGRQDEINEEIIRLMDLKKSSKVLDIGCGTGFVTRAISHHLDAKNGGVAIGIDAAAKMIEGARNKRGAKTCRFEVAAAENIEFEDDYFDVVVSTLFFHHVDVAIKKKTLTNAFRVLKPGGRLIIADMHTPTNLFGTIISHASRWILFQPEIGENIKGVLPELIAGAGFKTPEIVRTYFGYISVFTSSKPG